jgi:tyrosine-protein phosphatase YwqE
VIARLWKRLSSPSSTATAKDDTRPDGGGRLPFHTDLHAHILPGIDDGAPDLEQSLSLLCSMQELGYRRLYLTPHVMADSYRNSSETIRHTLERLRQAARNAGIDLELHASAEYYLDEELERRLKRRDILPLAGGYLLFETSYYAEPIHLFESIYAIQAAGYRPILAHPERYRYVTDPQSFYGRIRETGTLLQININSLGGHYGRDAREKAHWLAAQGWIDLLGSDLHSAKHAESLRRTIHSGVLDMVLARNAIQNDRLGQTPDTTATPAWESAPSPLS